MKITLTQLRSIIKEEVQRSLISEVEISDSEYKLFLKLLKKHPELQDEVDEDDKMQKLKDKKIGMLISKALGLKRLYYRFGDVDYAIVGSKIELRDLGAGYNRPKTKLRGSISGRDLKAAGLTAKDVATYISSRGGIESDLEELNNGLDNPYFA